MGRILRLVVTVALMVIMFAVGWVVAKTGMGSGVDSVLLTDRERQFTERMSGTSLIGRFTVDGREDRPAPGTLVQANVSIDDQGELEEENEHVIGQEAEVEVQAVVSAVAAGSVTLTVNGQLLVIPLPVGLTLPTSIIGTQVTLKVEFDEGNARVAADDEDEDDDDHVVTTPAMTTATLPTRHDDGDRGGSDVPISSG